MRKSQNQKELVIPIKLSDEKTIDVHGGELIVDVRLITEEAVITIPVELDGERIKPVQIQVGHLFKTLQERAIARRAKQA
jgi:hypothetical protein